MTLGSWLKTQKVYASRAYVSLVGWVITIGTFALVSYNDLIKIFPWMVVIFPNAFVFMFVSFPVVIAILAILGKWDWRTGTFPKEGETAFQNNPEWVKHREETEGRLDGMDERINNIIEKLDYDAGTLNDILDLLIKIDKKGVMFDGK